MNRVSPPLPGGGVASGGFFVIRWFAALRVLIFSSLKLYQIFIKGNADRIEVLPFGIGIVKQNKVG
jgi:hypothetical protein